MPGRVRLADGRWTMAEGEELVDEVGVTAAVLAPEGLVIGEDAEEAEVDVGAAHLDEDGAARGFVGREG